MLIVRTEQSFTGLGSEDWCSLWGLNKVLLVLGRRTGAHREDWTKFYWSWAGGPVLIVRTEQSFTGLGSEGWCSSWGLNKVLLVLGQRTGAHREDWTKFYWSWVGGPVLIMRTEQSFTGLGSEDWCSSWGLNKVLLVLGQRTGAHREDWTKFYWSWVGGLVLILRTEQSFTGLGPEEWCSSWGLNKVLLVLGRRTGAHHEDWTKFYWSWAGGMVLIVRTEQSFTGLGPEDWCSSWGLNKVLLVLGWRNGAHREDWTKFYWSWVGGLVLIVRTEQSFTGLGPEEWCSSWGLNKVLLVLGRRTGAHHEDWTKFYWSWVGGLVLIVRTEQSFTGLGPEDRCSSWGLNKVLLVLGRRTGAHHEDWTKFYWSWARGLVLIVRTEQSFTGLRSEDWCSSWGLNKVLLVLGWRNGAHREDWTKFYWSWVGGLVLIVRTEQSFTGLGPEEWCSSWGLNKVLLVLGRRTEQSFTGLGPEDRCSSWGLNKVLLVLGRRTGAHREDWTKFYWSWAGGLNKVLLVLGLRNGAHREDWTKFYWSWVGGLVLIMRTEQSFTGLGSEEWCSSWGLNKVLLVLGWRTEQSFTGLGSEDWCSSWGLNKVLLVLGRRNGAHREDWTKFYWSWVGGLVLIVRTEQSFTGLGPEDRCSSWGLNKVLLVLGRRTGAHHEDWTKFYWSWARGPVLIMRTEQSFTGLGSEDWCSSWGLNKVLLVLGRRNGAHHEDWTKFYWSWVGGPVLIVRTEQSFTGLGSEDRCSSWGLNKVLLVLGRRTGAHHEDWTKFYWSWVGGLVLIVRTEQSFTGLGSEDRCSSWGLNKVLLVLGWRTGAHHEDWTKFYWSWVGGLVLIVRTEQSFTGLGSEDWCSSWGLNKVLLVLGRRTGVNHEDWTKFYWSWARGLVLIVRTEQSFTGLGSEDRCSSWGLNKVLLVLGQRTGVYHEDWTKFYWSWTGGLVLIMRTEQSFTGLGPEDWCLSWGLNKVLLVLGLRTGAHREDWTKFYWSWVGGLVLIMRTEQSFTGLGSEDRCSSWGLNKVLLVLGRRTEQSFTGLGSEDRCSSWGLNKVLLVLGRRTGAHHEDWTKFYWSWVGGPVLIMRTEQSFTGLGSEDWCSSWGLNKVLLVLGRRNGAHHEDWTKFYWSWVGGPVLIVRTEQSFTGLGSEDGAHREDWTKFYWSWVGGLVLIMRTEQSFTGLGSEDWCSSWGLNKVLLVLGRRTGAHREDWTKFYWSWAGGLVLIMRTEQSFTGLGSEDWCSSWGLNKVLLVLGRRTGAHREDWTKFYWSWVGGLVLIMRTEQSFTGLGPEDWCSSWGLNKVLLVLGRRTGAHREDWTKFYWSWARGLVFIMRTEQSFTGHGPEDWCSSWGLNKVLLVLGQRTGVYHEDWTKFYWSWAWGLVLIVRTEQSFTGLGSEDWCSSWGLNKVLLVLGRRTGAHREDWTKFYWSWVGGLNKVLLVLGRRTGAHHEDWTKFYWSWVGGLVLIMRTEQSFTGLGSEDRCSSWGLNKVLLVLGRRTGAHREDWTKFYWSWVGGPVLIVRTEQSFTGLWLEDRCSSWGLNKVLLVLDRRTGAHHEDWTKFYWSWARGLVLIVRTEQSFTGLGSEDRCSSWGLNKVLLVLDRRTGAHHEDWTKFYWSWVGGLVLIMRTEQSFTGLGPEDRCSSWGLNKVLLVLGLRTGAHHEDWTKFYWSWVGGLVLIVRTEQSFTGLGSEDRCSSWGLNKVLLVLGRRTGAHREDWTKFYWSWVGGLVLIMRTEQSFTGLGSEDRCSSWGLNKVLLVLGRRTGAHHEDWTKFYWSWAWGMVLIVRTEQSFTGLGSEEWCSSWGLNKVLLVLGQRNGAHREDWTKFYWSWVGGLVLIVRTEQSFTGLGSEDWCSSWGLNKVLLVLGLRTGTHHEDWTKFYWSWVGGLVLIVRTEQSFTGLGSEDWCSSWGLNKVLLVLGRRTGAHREDWTKFYWSWAGGLVLIVRTEQSFTGLGSEDWCSSWGLNKVLLVLGRRTGAHHEDWTKFYWSWAWGMVLIVRTEQSLTGLGSEDWCSSWGLNKVLLVLGRRTGAHREDWTKFYWSWVGGPVLIVRTEQSFTGLGSEDWCSSWGLNKVLLVLGRRTGAHREDWTKFYWSWVGGLVLIMRTEQSFTGLGSEDRCSSWGLNKVLLVLGLRNGAHREDWTKFYWSWVWGMVLIMRTEQSFTGLGSEDWCSSWGLNKVLLVLGRRTGAHREDWTKFYWSWTRGMVLIMRTEQSFTGLGSEDWCSSWGLNKVLLVLGRRTGAHREDWTKFYRSWARGLVLIVRTEQSFTGLGSEDWCSSWGLNKVLLVLGLRNGAHREDWTKFYWSWVGGLVLIVRTEQSFTGLGSEDWCSSWGLNKVLLVLGRRTGAHREDWTKVYWSWVGGPVLIVRTEQSFTGLGSEDWCSSWGLNKVLLVLGRRTGAHHEDWTKFYWSWAWGMVLIVRTEQSLTGLGSEDWCSSWGLNKVLLVLGRRTGAHHEDWTKFYWSWVGGPVLIVRTEQSFTGLGSEDWCSSWGLNKVLLVLGRRTGAHHEDWTKFYWSWVGGLVLIVRTEQSFTGLGSEDWCSSWGLNKVLLVLGLRNGAHREDWTKFYWSWVWGMVLIMRTEQSFTGLGSEDWCSSWGLNKVLLVLGRRTGAHREDWTKFYWSWTRGMVLIMRTEQSFTGLGSEDWCSSWGLNKVLLVLGRRTGAHREDWTKFYWSWARGLVLIVRTEQSFTGLGSEDREDWCSSWGLNKVLLVLGRRTGAHREDWTKFYWSWVGGSWGRWSSWCSSWGLNKVLLVLGRRTGAHREDWTKFYWSWVGGPVLIMRTEQSFTGLGSEDWCPSWGLNKVLLVLGLRNGAHREDWTKFYWSWFGGLVLIMRTEQSFTGLGSEDWCSSWGLNKVLLVLGRRTGAHREDWTKFYWSWVGGLVLIVRTEQSFTGLGSEDWCSSWGLNKVLLVLGRRTGAHREDWTKFYWSWVGGPVLIVRTEQSFTGLGSEDWCSSWGLNKVLLVLGRRTGAHREDWTKFYWSWVGGMVLIMRTVIV